VTIGMSGQILLHGVIHVNIYTCLCSVAGVGEPAAQQSAGGPACGCMPLCQYLVVPDNAASKACHRPFPAYSNQVHQSKHELGSAQI
jgi:hypothetical protein